MNPNGITCTRLYQGCRSHHHYPWISISPEVEILADPIFKKVFYNFLDNSVRHGKKVREIRVSTREGPEGLVIFWEDDGVGVPAYEKEKIFSKDYGRHTGLGLFLVAEICSVTGITVHETGEPGRGARFEPAGAPRKITGLAVNVKTRSIKPADYR